MSSNQKEFSELFDKTMIELYESNFPENYINELYQTYQLEQKAMKSPRRSIFKSPREEKSKSPRIENKNTPRGASKVPKIEIKKPKEEFLSSSHDEKMKPSPRRVVGKITLGDKKDELITIDNDNVYIDFRIAILGDNEIETHNLSLRLLMGWEVNVYDYPTNNIPMKEIQIENKRILKMKIYNKEHIDENQKKYTLYSNEIGRAHV